MRSSKGFTLIEVALSVAILGVALTTLVALQSGYMRAYRHERNLVRAALVAQYMLSIWEGDDDIPNPGRSEKPLGPILKKLGYFAENDGIAATEPEFEGWFLARQISNIGIPPIENVLRKIELELIWGPEPNERFPIVYFVKNSELQTNAEDDEDENEPTADAGADAGSDDGE